MKNEETTATKTTAVTEHATPGAPSKVRSKKAATRKKAAHAGRKTANSAKLKKAAKAGKNAKPARAKAAASRAESKGDKILEMIGRAKGVTLAEIMTATGWQAHSVRGFISTVGKKRGVRIESKKSEAGDRTYRVVK